MSDGCFDCPRACGADRTRSVGYCGVGYYARLAKTVSPFLYEEPCLGAVTAVFFSGCNLGCSYCQNYRISRAAVGEEFDDEALASFFDDLPKNRALDLVTPTHVLSAIERALSLCKTHKRIIYNTSGYETEQATARAARFTDVFLTDFKYADNGLAARLSHAPDYFDRAARAVKIMRKIPDEWKTVGGKRILKRGMIVRHLVLPGYVENSIKTLDFIAETLGTDTVISLMSQFTPNGVGQPERRLKNIEYKIVAEHALKLGFKNGYFQEFESASGEYTPNF